MAIGERLDRWIRGEDPTQSYTRPERLLAILLCVVIYVLLTVAFLPELAPHVLVEDGRQREYVSTISAVITIVGLIWVIHWRGRPVEGSRLSSPWRAIAFIALLVACGLLLPGVVGLIELSRGAEFTEIAVTRLAAAVGGAAVVVGVIDTYRQTPAKDMDALVDPDLP